MKGSAKLAKVGAELRKTGGMMSSRKKPIQPQGKKKVKGAKNPNETSDTKRKIARMQSAKKTEADTAELLRNVGLNPFRTTRILFVMVVKIIMIKEEV